MSAHLVYGIDDERRTGAVIGVTQSPTDERIGQLLVQYTGPVPRWRRARVAFGAAAQDGRDIDDGVSVDVVQILFADTHPHWATREVTGMLDPEVVYVRRGPQVGRASMSEVESLFRAKAGRLDGRTDRMPSPAVRSAPMRVGFVEARGWSSPPIATARVVNLTDAPITDIEVVVDVSLRAFPAVVDRRRLALAAALPGGASEEYPIDVRHDAMFAAPEDVRRNDRIQHRWADLTLIVRYRDADGFLRREISELSLTD